jgi:hypothetical protein
LIPNGREILWFGIGVATVMFIVPWVRGAMAGRQAG